MGIVLLMNQLRLNRLVAVKFIKEGHLSPDRVDRFFREARVLAAVNHRSVVAVYDAGMDADRPYIVCEYVEGETLAARLSSSPALGTVEDIEIALEILDGLAVIARKGIIHRDLKPGNVFLTLDGHAKIGDFGLAREQNVPSGTVAMMLLGTPAYMAPERCLGKPASPSSDLYALGVILYELLAGRRPFLGPRTADFIYQHVREPPPSIRSLKPDVPEPLEALVLRALAKEPGARFQTAGEFGELLRRIRDTMRTTDSVQSPCRPPAGSDGDSPTPVVVESVRAEGQLVQSPGEPAEGGRTGSRGGSPWVNMRPGSAGRGPGESVSESGGRMPHDPLRTGGPKPERLHLRTAAPAAVALGLLLVLLSRTSPPTAQPDRPRQVPSRGVTAMTPATASLPPAGPKRPGLATARTTADACSSVVLVTGQTESGPSGLVSALEESLGRKGFDVRRPAELQENWWWPHCKVLLLDGIGADWAVPPHLLTLPAAAASQARVTYERRAAAALERFVNQGGGLYVAGNAVPLASLAFAAVATIRLGSPLRPKVPIELRVVDQGLRETIGAQLSVPGEADGFLVPIELSGGCRPYIEAWTRSSPSTCLRGPLLASFWSGQGQVYIGGFTKGTPQSADWLRVAQCVLRGLRLTNATLRCREVMEQRGLVLQRASFVQLGPTGFQLSTFNCTDPSSLVFIAAWEQDASKDRQSVSLRITSPKGERFLAIGVDSPLQIKVRSPVPGDYRCAVGHGRSAPRGVPCLLLVASQP